MTGESLEDLVSVGADVDVKALMEEIGAEVRRKLDAGAYPPEALTDLETTLRAAGRESADTTAEAINALVHSAVFSSVVTTDSRKPVVAPMISRAKRVIQSSVRWYMTGVLEQVGAFAAYTVRVVRALDDRISELEEQMGGAELDDLRERLERLEGAHLGDRVARIDRAVRDLRNRVEDAAVGRAAPGGGTGAGRGRSWETERSFDYLGLENRFRGSEAAILERQRAYVELFGNPSRPVVDLGCGRGEFLRLLREAGVEAYGVDRHPDMLAHCRGFGLEVVEADALDHLAGIEEASLGGIFAAQVIEHLDARDVPRFFELTSERLVPGGTLVVETINPGSLFTFAHAFYIDLGHLRPLHPATLDLLAHAAGFTDVRVEYLHPPPEEVRPQNVPMTGDRCLDASLNSVNESFERIDQLLFGPQDYAVIARR